MRHPLLAACGGFLLGVLWMDLLFDVQARGLTGGAEFPEPVLASIAGYYRRVTTDAAPMQHLIGLVMGTTIVTAVTGLGAGPARGWRIVGSLLCVGPITLAAARVFPAAVTLGARGDSLAAQSRLAAGIWQDHVACFAAMAAFTTLQVLLARRAR